MRFTSLHSTIMAAGYPQSKPCLGCIRIQDDEGAYTMLPIIHTIIYKCPEVFIIWKDPRIALVNPNPNPLLMPARMVHPYGAKHHHCALAQECCQYRKHSTPLNPLDQSSPSASYIKDKLIILMYIFKKYILFLLYSTT